MKTIILLSGGLDSAVAMAMALSSGEDAIGLVVDYGQRHRVEIDHARALALHYGVPLKEALVSLPFSDGVALLGGGDVPTGRSADERGGGLSPTYVPARNTVFLSLAMGLAETVDASSIVIGSTSSDVAGYPDCRPAYMAAFGYMARVAGVPVEIRAPLIHMSKREVVRAGRRLGVPFELTRSCYLEGEPCGECDACAERSIAMGGD